MNSTFFTNTDTVDIDAQAIGVTPLNYKARGLGVQIRHNRDKALFETANQMAKIIAKALNEAVENGTLKLPKGLKDE